MHLANLRPCMFSVWSSGLRRRVDVDDTGVFVVSRRVNANQVPVSAVVRACHDVNEVLPLKEHLVKCHPAYLTMAPSQSLSPFSRQFGR